MTKPFIKSVRTYLLSLLALVMICALCCTGCSPKALNYGDPALWAYDGLGDGKAADLFLVCPTIDMGEKGNYNMDLNDEDMRKRFIGALNMERGIYEDTLTLYAPFYRQAAFTVYEMTGKEADRYLQIAYEDVRAAFLYFVEHTPDDRPFVLAGFSQGSDMVLRLLKEFFHDPVYQERLIAAYCIGWRVTDADLEDCSWLTPAESADDTGVIVSFNSEAEDVQASIPVPKGVITHSINPLNWKADSTPASADLNEGACFTNYNGEIEREIPCFSGAYIDEARGTLKVTDVIPKDYANALFPDGVYHLYDYHFFYRNLQKNVALRTEAYFSKALSNAA